MERGNLQVADPSVLYLQNANMHGLEVHKSYNTLQVED